MKWVYLSGPITGMPDGNRVAFAEAEKIMMRVVDGVGSVLTPFDVVMPQDAAGGVINPADAVVDVAEPTWADYMRECLCMLAKCDTIAMLDGWEKSRGARLELHVALKLGLRVVFVRDFVKGADCER
ncbi:MAG TPA: DUF4406 domain-containing protein [Kiritimatiellia bacterium]|nr:DUF4406 domain-containing protein [Kiritimatiellia bacterium]HRU70194.1 DUF4406 domain-containing protein [Kiritimatiellia bacterium]